MKTRFNLLIILLSMSLLFSCGKKQATLTPTVAIQAAPTPQPTSPPVPTQASTEEESFSPERITRAQEFVNLLVQGDFTTAEDMFDATMKAAMPASTLEETWDALLKQVGAFQEQVGVHTQTVQGYDVVFVTCQFEQMLIDVKVVFNSSGQVAGLFFLPGTAQTYEPPAYVQADTFQEQEVSLGSGEWTLPGTLTLPVGDGPYPAMVLVHGSGPNDRDESLGPNKPFRDLAWGLASQGIAVLRYEKRTKQYPEKMAAIQNTLTVKEETIDDALAAVNLLRQTAAIDPQHIFVLGHSLGGMLVPRIGAADEKIAGLISMAGPARPFEDIILEQVTYIANLDGTISAEEQAQLEALAEQVARVKNPQLSSQASGTDFFLGASAAYWLDLRNYQPAETAKSLNCPILILQGGRDYQVTRADFDLWKSTLASHSSAAMPNVQFKFYPDLNHLFYTGEGQITPGEYNNPGHVAEQVIIDIATWIKSISL